MITRKEKDLINEGWYRLKRAIENQSWGQYPGKYLEVNRDEERQHRRGHEGFGCSVDNAAKYFAIKWAVPFLTREKEYVPTVKDYLRVRQGVFHGCSLWLNFEEEIRKSFEGFDKLEFAKLDYCKMVQTRQEKQEAKS